MQKVTPEVEKIFRQFRTSVGAPIRNIQMTDDMLCDILDIAQEDYAEKVQKERKRCVTSHLRDREGFTESAFCSMIFRRAI